MLTQGRLKELLHYDHETGVFTWVVKKGSRATKGSVAGWVDKDGYICITVDKRKYKSHRLAWLYVYGEWPISQIDHINRSTGDNRLSNLREATGLLNQQNRKTPSSNTSGHTGVNWHKASSKWIARITVNYKMVYLGVFEEINDAIKCYAEAKQKLHTFI